MLTIEQIRAALADRVTTSVAQAIGVHPETIRRIKRGESARYDILKALSDYLTGSQ